MLCHSVVEGRPVVLVLVYRSSHQATVVLDSAVGTVRRRQYRHNRSTSKTQSKIIMVERHFKQSTISPQTNTIDNSPTIRAMCSWWEKEEGCEGTKGLNMLKWLCWSWHKVEFSKKRIFRCDTSRKNSQVRFYKRHYYGCIRLLSY